MLKSNELVFFRCDATKGAHEASFIGIVHNYELYYYNKEISPATLGLFLLIPYNPYDSRTYWPYGSLDKKKRIKFNYM